MKSEVASIPKDPPPFDLQIEMLEKQLAHMRQLRTRQSWVSLAGVLVILALFAMFITNLVSLARDFNTAAMAEEMASNSEIVTGSPELAAMGMDFKEIMLPAIKEEMTRAFEKKLPEFKKQGLKSIDELQAFMLVEMRNKVIKRMDTRLRETEKKLLSKCDPKDSVVLEKAFERLNERFIAELTGLLEKQLQGAVESLAGLDAQVQQFKKTSEFSSIAKQNSGEVENKLLETFLELWIYQLDPAKGKIPAFAAVEGSVRK